MARTSLLVMVMSKMESSKCVVVVVVVVVVVFQFPVFLFLKQDKLLFSNKLALKKNQNAYFVIRDRERLKVFRQREID